MSYRDLIMSSSNLRWSIDLATHLGTPIPNETSHPTLQLTRNRQKREAEFLSMLDKVRGPIAGYNCFGHVFASRRTGLYEADIESILCEDGFAEIKDEREFAEQDVVVYFDGNGPFHAARIVKFESIPLAIDAKDPESSVRVPYVVSKLDDVSGEYLHKLADLRWWTLGTHVTQKVYRERWKIPCRKPNVGWRTIVQG